jgi:hypothetical protein
VVARLWHGLMKRVSLRFARADAAIFRAPALIAPSGSRNSPLINGYMFPSNLNFFDFLRRFALPDENMACGQIFVVTA